MNINTYSGEFYYNIQLFPLKADVKVILGVDFKGQS